MTPYQPNQISNPQGGWVIDYEAFNLENDQFEVMENVYLRFGKIYKKPIPGYLGRLRRAFTASSLGNAGGGAAWSFNFYSTVVPNISGGHPELVPGSVIIHVNGAVATFNDAGDGTFTVGGSGTSGTINYSSGDIVLNFAPAPGVVPVTVDFAYYPGLPVMGLRQRELSTEGQEDTIAFDTTYAYEFVNGVWRELPSTAPTTWTGNDENFFWTTNFYNEGKTRLFWATNDSGNAGDPIRYYNGTTWTDFTNLIEDAATAIVRQCRIILPFRGRLLMMNTWEGDPSPASPTHYPVRIRWSAINSILGTDDWKDNIPGKGGFLDLPANENIISAGFIRDNLVIFCERSTWQLRYTGQSIQPFQAEKINTELGSKGAFATIQFDTELDTIGDRGIVSCDSFSTKRIDEKIQTFAFNYMNNDFSGPKRIQSARDFSKLLAYWTYPSSLYNSKWPDYLLVRNYNEESWSNWRNSYTALGLHYKNNDATWETSEVSWEQFAGTWRYQQSLFPLVVGGNQQGFVLSLLGPIAGITFPQRQSLAIYDITGIVGDPAVFTIYDHNLQNYVEGGSNGDVVIITGILSGDPYESLNGRKFGIERITDDTVYLLEFDTLVQDFQTRVTVPVGTYKGYGRAAQVDNFYIVTKKFNYLDSGEKITLGHVDMLLDKVEGGAFTVKVYTNYSEQAVITKEIDNSNSSGQQTGQVKTFQRARLPSRGDFVQLEYTLSPAQMNGDEEQEDFTMSDQIIWTKPAGKTINTR